MDSMDPIWRHLPVDLVYKICNLLVHVRHIDENLKKEICNQEYLLDKIWYNNLSLFGIFDSWEVTFHDLYTYIVHNEINIRRDDVYEYTSEQLCRSVWALLKPCERSDIIAWSIG
jgi:hypothetical protein